MNKVKNITIISLIGVLVLMVVHAPREVLMFLPELFAAVPEILVLFDLGGIELVISFLLLYLKPLRLKLQIINQRIKQEISICVCALRNSALLQPKM